MEDEELTKTTRPMRGMRRRRRRRRGGLEVSLGGFVSATEAYSPTPSYVAGGSRCSFECDSPLAGFVVPGPAAEQETLAISPNNAPLEEELIEAIQEPTKKNSISYDIQECSNRRFRSEAAAFSNRKHRRQRPASLDFGNQEINTAVLSPGFLVGGLGVTGKSSDSSLRSKMDAFPSPGTPNYHRHGASAVGYQKGWSSERVPLPSNTSRRYGSGSLVLPFNHGRALPSKWEDAERWIFSPSGDGLPRAALPQNRRPKAKSGPLGPTGRNGGPYSSVSSAVSLLDSGRVGHLAANSPLLAGVLIPEHVCVDGNTIGMVGGGGGGSNGRGGRPCFAYGGPHVMSSARVRRRLDTAVVSSPSLPSSGEFTQDERVEIIEEADTTTPVVVLRKDVATQTSPERSIPSSPKAKPSFSRSLSAQQVKELESCFSKVEIRDVQVDDRVTVTRWSKKYVTRCSDKDSTNIVEWKKKTLESKATCLEVTETAKCISKFEGEEAKIKAWENLQKAKAEAAIQKLVIKLEKTRSFSLDRIFNKLRSAQKKAQEMRTAASANQDQCVAKTPKKPSHLNKNGQISSLSGCFTCHAF